VSRFGHNLGYVDELYRRFLADPASVSEAWQEFFRDYRPDPATAGDADPSAVAAAAEARTAESATNVDVPGEAQAEPLRGISARVAENMEGSLEVPTATSARTVAVKLLEENRRVLNQHQATVSGARVSFTHLIAWAVVRALEAHPEINVTYGEIEGKPHRLRHSRINLGIAVDVMRREERVLLVPCLKDAGSLDFPTFLSRYDDLVARARDNKLTVDDFQGATVTITNPGMLGTVMSVPRLMQGQGAILGFGSIGYPAEYTGTDPEKISELGISKVMTVTNTYDHRVIQGAGSGRLLGTFEGLLQGNDGFYRRIFAEMDVPREPIEWSGDHVSVGGASGTGEAIAKQAGVLQLIRAFRVRGHLWADLDPLGYAPRPNSELELSTYGLSVWDLDRRFMAGGLGGHTGTLTLREISDTLQRTYCRHVGVEFMHIPDPPARSWLYERLEHPRNQEPFNHELKLHILQRLSIAEAFETFLHTNYVGQKRFSLEGAETLIPLLHVLLDDAADANITDAVIGMAHRGRLNVAANIVGKPYGKVFGEFEDVDPESAHGSGDVKYHLGCSGTFLARDGKEVAVAISANPSHLEAVDPVVEGRVRARQDRAGDAERVTVLPILIHGDAAFAGQGVVAETLHLSQLRGYRTGGTVHVIVNNQIGFTTGPADARSSLYPTDVAKMVHAPIFHVNADYPEQAVRMARLALEYRNTFHADVVVDLVCYRRWGHNEADDPSYTHPTLYSKIEKHRSVRKLYTEQLLRSGDLDLETAEQALDFYRHHLQQVRDEVRAAEQQRRGANGSTAAVELGGPTVADHEDDDAPDTAVDREDLERVVQALESTPDDFAPHPKLAKLLARRRESFEDDRIDWALGEALAFGSLVREGVPVRLSGEDSGRGTFSHRHAVLYDHRDATPYVSLDHVEEGQAPFQVFDSLLSEFAVLGFEYGYSVDHPAALVMWEAQFGDFVNGAQVIIDQFMVCAEEKWDQRSGVVLLLPHGYEGQGPEHSSARLERFLQLAARDCIRVCYPSTPAQYFHLLRDQARRRERPRPLVVMTPKSLLRHPAVVSPAGALSAGRFEPLLDDPRGVDRSAVRRVLLCSGKIYYDLVAALESNDGGAPGDTLEIVRVERLYPLPETRLRELLENRPDLREVCWVQEEPANMGAWSHVRAPLAELVGEHAALRLVSRRESSSPATGSHKRHVTEQRRLVESALQGSPDEAPATLG
jgi:2-oxoglutarate dehydrogenase E1 component